MPDAGVGALGSLRRRCLATVFLVKETRRLAASVTTSLRGPEVGRRSLASWCCRTQFGPEGSRLSAPSLRDEEGRARVFQVPLRLASRRLRCARVTGRREVNSSWTLGCISVFSQIRSLYDACYHAKPLGASSKNSLSAGQFRSTVYTDLWMHKIIK